jgi:hypothetical protein
MFVILYQQMHFNIVTMFVYYICEKGNIMNCWESLHIQLLQQQQLLIDEQRVNDLNPLYSLVITAHHTIRSD